MGGEVNFLLINHKKALRIYEVYVAMENNIIIIEEYNALDLYDIIRKKQFIRDT